MEMGRLKYEKQDKYCTDVLIGNWSEQRCSYTKDPHDFRTSYMNHYPPKPISANDPGLVWDQIIRTQGYGARVLFDHEAPHYLENKSTTYDLSYNHFTKVSDGPIPRELRFRFQRYEPEKEFTRNFGNITKSGLLDYYRETWRCQKLDPRPTVTTVYQDTFLPPRKEDLVLKHMAIPLPNSSIMDKNNNAMSAITLRGDHLGKVPENELVPYDPKKPRYNPITWERPPGVREEPKMCGQEKKI